MKLFRISVFIFFSIALYGSIDCLADSGRVLEHNGAWFGMYICVISCILAIINPSKLL